MKFLKRLIYKWYNEIERSECNVVQKSSEPSSGYLGHGISFTVHNAIGGTVINTSIFDEAKHDHIRSLYIINDSDDFAESIANIVTQETLKHGSR